MPDGTMHGAPPRAVALMESGSPRCSRCARPLPVTVGSGSVLVTCRSKKAGARCGQHLAVIGAAEGCCIVVPVTSDEFGELTSSSARDMLQALALLNVPLLAAS